MRRRRMDKPAHQNCRQQQQNHANSQRASRQAASRTEEPTVIVSQHLDHTHNKSDKETNADNDDCPRKWLTNFSGVAHAYRAPTRAATSATTALTCCD